MLEVERQGRMEGREGWRGREEGREGWRGSTYLKPVSCHPETISSHTPERENKYKINK